jgi:hypothetical protein
MAKKSKGVKPAVPEPTELQSALANLGNAEQPNNSINIMEEMTVTQFGKFVINYYEYYKGTYRNDLTGVETQGLKRRKAQFASIHDPQKLVNRVGFQRKDSKIDDKGKARIRFQIVEIEPSNDFVGQLDD